jgi:predicted esterase
MEKAEEAGYSTENIYFGGHSLGGIVLESYISGHSEIANGIALLGTWLPDLLGEKSMYGNPLLKPIPCCLFQGQQ